MCSSDLKTHDPTRTVQVTSDSRAENYWLQVQWYKPGKIQPQQSINPSYEWNQEIFDNPNDFRIDLKTIRMASCTSTYMAGFSGSDCQAANNCFARLMHSGESSPQAQSSSCSRWRTLFPENRCLLQAAVMLMLMPALNVIVPLSVGS